MYSIFRFMLILLIAAFFLSEASCVSAEEALSTSSLTFDRFYRQVMDYYPKLKAAHADVEAALARQMQASAGFWPSFGLTAGYSVTDDPVNVFGMLLRQERYSSGDSDLKRQNTPDPHQDFAAGIRIDLPLFDAMQTVYSTRRAREEVTVSGCDEDFTRMEAALMSADAYLHALTLDKLLTVIDGVSQDSIDDLKKASDLKEKGMIQGADYFMAKVISGEFIRIRNDLARQKEAMQALMNILMGHEPASSWVPIAALNTVLIPSKNTQALIETAFERRPDIKALNGHVRSAEIDRAQARATALPQFAIFGNATNDRSKLSVSGGNNFAIGLKGELPLFDPSRAGRVRASKVKQERAEFELALLKDNIRRDITAEVARHEAVRDNMTVLQDIALDAAKAVEMMLPLYNEGRRSIADLLEARRTYWHAHQAYTMAVMEFWVAQAKLLFLSGKMTDDDMKTFAMEAGL